MAIPAGPAVPGHVQTPAQQEPGRNPAATQPSHAQQPQEDAEDLRADMEEGVKHLLVSQVEAWNHGRLEGFMQGYWRSPDLTFFSGDTVTKGWEPTLARYQQRYQSQGKEMGRLEFQELKIDIVGRKAAIATGRWQLTLSDSKKPDGKTPHGLFTLVVKRMPGGWKIVHDHTSSE